MESGLIVLYLMVSFVVTQLQNILNVGSKMAEKTGAMAMKQLNGDCLQMLVEVIMLVGSCPPPEMKTV